MEQPKPYGRIRLFQDQADYLHTLLKLERDRVTLQRRMHKKEAGTHPFNRQIHFIDQMLNEVERMSNEMGWRSTDDQTLETGS